MQAFNGGALLLIVLFLAVVIWVFVVEDAEPNKDEDVEEYNEFGKR